MSDQLLRTTCGYCSTGCNVVVQASDGKPVKVLPAADYPVNLGRTCPKGYHLLKPLEAPDRATRPLLRDAEGRLVPVSWDEALDRFVSRFKAVQAAHGPAAVAFLSTGQIPTEEMAFLGALAKFGMGVVHGDGNTRQCMATAAVAYKQAFGFDAPPFSYKDFEESDLMIFVGANPLVAHPIMWNRVKMNKRPHEIVVIDPRRTATAEAATIHLAVRPKSDLTLLYALTNIIIRNGWVKRDFVDAHTAGFEELARHVAAFDVARASEASGLAPAAIEALARKIHEAERASFYWTMGVNQSHQGVRTAQAIINLALVTGNIGRPGTGPNSITGQANAMGSRLFSNTTSLMGGYDFLNADHRRRVASILGIDERLIPAQNSLAYDRILEAVDEGKIKGLWIIATNPGHSWINRNSLAAVLGKLDFLVVQDMYATTETAQIADLVLPAAAAGEKSGTFINSERRFGILQAVAKPPGEALSDFEIFRRIADRWGCGALFREWTHPEAVFQILKRLSAGQPCDITGIRDYRMIIDEGGVQWPWPAGAAAAGRPPRERRLFEDGRFFTPDGRAKLLFDDIAPLPEAPDDDYPMILLTGRGTVAQWHTQTRTGKVEILRKLYPQDAYAEINPQDARRLNVKEGDRVKVVSRRGEALVAVAIRDSSQPGQLFIPMHYMETNRLTFPAFDPYSREPAYKLAAVRVEKA